MSLTPRVFRVKVSVGSKVPVSEIVAGIYQALRRQGLCVEGIAEVEGENQ